MKLPKIGITKATKIKMTLSKIENLLFLTVKNIVITNNIK